MSSASVLEVCMEYFMVQNSQVTFWHTLDIEHGLFQIECAFDDIIKRHEAKFSITYDHVWFCDGE